MKGFANILTMVLIGVLAVAGGFIGGSIGNNVNNLGATIYTTNLSDTIEIFRSNVNSSLTNLNNALPAQTLNTTSSPEFAGLTLTGKSGIAKFSAGILGTATSGTDYEVPLTASSGLNRVGNAFILNMASTTCGVASHVSSISATGTIICSADTSTTTLSVSTLDVSSTSTLSNTIMGGTTSTISSTNLNITAPTTTFSNNVAFNSTTTGSGLSNFIGWYKLGSATIAVESATATVAISGTHKAYMIEAFFTSTVTNNLRYFVFNSDVSANYAHVISENNGADNVNNGRTNIGFAANATASSTYITAFLNDSPNYNKTIYGFANGVSLTATAPNRADFSGTYATTTRISSISITAGGGNLGIGSYIIVYGSSD